MLWKDFSLKQISNYFYSNPVTDQKPKSTSSLKPSSWTRTASKALRVTLVTLFLATSLGTTSAASSQEICKPVYSNSFHSLNIELPIISEARIKTLQALTPPKAPFDFSSPPSSIKEVAYVDFYRAANWINKHIKVYREYASEVIEALKAVPTEKFLKTLRSSAREFSQQIGKEKCITYIPLTIGSTYWVNALFFRFIEEKCLIATQSTLEGMLRKSKVKKIIIAEDAAYSGAQLGILINQVYQRLLAYCYAKNCSYGYTIYVAVPIQTYGSVAKFIQQTHHTKTSLPPLKNLIYILPFESCSTFGEKLSNKAVQIFSKAYGKNALEKSTCFLPYKIPSKISIPHSLLDGEIPPEYAIHPWEKPVPLIPHKHIKRSPYPS